MRGSVVDNNQVAIELAVDTVRRGGLVICPTITNYVLVCDAFDPEAIRRVFEVKKRTRVAPLSVIAPSVSAIADYVHIPEWFPEETLDRLMPGPIGFIFPQKLDFPVGLTCGLKTVAVAHTADGGLSEICSRFGAPLAATSANLSGQGQIRTSLEKAVSDLGDEVDLIVDGGPTMAQCIDGDSTKAATMVDCSLGRPYLCRDGVLSSSVLKVHLPNLETDVEVYYEAMRKRNPSFPDLTFDHDTLEIVTAPPSGPAA